MATKFLQSPRLPFAVSGGFSRSLKAPLPLPSAQRNELRLDSGMTSDRRRWRMVEHLRQQGIDNEAVLNAMAQVPRHAFVEEALASRAYEDMTLPIGLGQSISQPFIVADMLARLCEGRPRLGKTLEIGAGCGYQAAVLAQLTTPVYAIERLESLYRQTQSRLQRLKLTAIHLCHGDGFLGWPDEAPFDSIIVAAAPAQVPPRLLDQMAMGGRLVMPLGDDVQKLIVIDRTEQGFVENIIYGVRFVPMLGGVE